MHYSEATQKLQQLFESREYRILIQQRLRHKHRDLIHTCSNGTAIYISYPGLKARIERNTKIVYDYRVDIETSQLNASLSHANIIVDIYNKCFQGFDRELMKQILIQIAREGLIDANQYYEIKSYSCSTVDKTILCSAMDAHQALGKTYNSEVNQSDLTFEELFISIFWIVLQEDFNYPMPRYQGRKMPFSRYLEALYCFESDHKLDEVITRALVEGYPPNQWRDMDYSFLVSIN
jgi:hypothetical protein